MFYRKSAKASRLLAIMIAAGLSATSLPAGAATPESNADFVVRQVSAAGLDLSKEADQAAMRHRVRIAAEQVCEETKNGLGIESDAFRDCYLRAIADAWPQLDAKIAAARSRNMVATASPRH